MSCICTVIPALELDDVKSVVVILGKTPAQILLDVADDLDKDDNIEVITTITT